MIKFELPEETDSPPPEFSDCYERARYDEPKFRLTASAKQYIAEREAELASIEAEAERELAAERAAHERTRSMLRERTIDHALTEALKAHGANPRTRHGAAAQLRTSWEFKVDGDSVVVCSAEGEREITQAVENWLAGEAGEAFAQRRPPTNEITQRIMRVTTTR